MSFGIKKLKLGAIAKSVTVPIAEDSMRIQIGFFEAGENGAYHKSVHLLIHGGKFGGKAQLGELVEGCFVPVNRGGILATAWSKSGIEVVPDDNCVRLTKPGVYRINGIVYAVGEVARIMLQRGRVRFPRLAGAARLDS